MGSRLRTSLIVLAIGVIWTMLWATIGISITLFALVVQPDVVGPGEGPLDIALILGPLGLPAGIAGPLSIAIARVVIRRGALIA